MKLTQLERIRARLHDRGFISRNDCLKNFITRLGARICDLEAEGYVFSAGWKGKDYCYILLSINGVPYQNPAARAQIMRENAALCEWFDNYPTKVIA